MRIDVTFDSAGIAIAGHLYLPDGVQPGAPRRLPTVVVGHPASGVKEQTAGLYAARLAGQGFVALAFDSAFQGESGGLPRNQEDSAHRVEDLRAAVSYLTVRPEVDIERIGALGICASGGYVIPAAATDPRIKAVATVSAVDVGRSFRYGADGARSPEAARGLLERAAAARSAQARGEGMAGFPTNAPDEATARAGTLHDVEGWEYYRTPRAEHPRSAREFTWDSVDRILAFDAFRHVDTISPRPLLMIVGANAVTRQMSVDAVAAAAEPKRLHLVEGATHVSLYDVEEHVGEAVAELTAFYAEALGEHEAQDHRYPDRRSLRRPSVRPARGQVP